MDEKVLDIISDIIKRGNDVEVRRKKDGVIIVEVKRHICYNSSEKSSG